ncbi:hypothetical protein OAZ92_01205 [Prochlorococcus sp. AH-736-E02]|nr:hypothetical protein [Prochlorococcus sp. AH-736-E02]
MLSLLPQESIATGRKEAVSLLHKAAKLQNQLENKPKYLISLV